MIKQNQLESYQARQSQIGSKRVDVNKTDSKRVIRVTQHSKGSYMFIQILTDMIISYQKIIS